YAGPVPAQPVAAARAALAGQDAGPHQMLQDLLEVSLGNPLALCDVTAAHRVIADVESHVEHRLDGEHRLLAEARHPVLSSPLGPVAGARCYPCGPEAARTA